MRTIRSVTPATGCATTDQTTKACELDIFGRCVITVGYVCNRAAHQRRRFVRDLEESRQSDAELRGEAKSFGRSSTDVMWGFAAGRQGSPAEKAGYSGGQPLL